MIDGLKVLAMIPARGGSKGLPRKNVLDLAGRPLIAWTIDAARQSRYLDRVVLSSDDDEIMAVAERHGCEVPFRRPAELADDSATTVDALRHTLAQLPGYDIVVVLQPTNPLRSSADIDATLERLVNGRAHSCVTVTAPDKSPYWTFALEDGALAPLLGEEHMAKRRQELPETWVLNGAVYAARCDWFAASGVLVGRGTLGQPMPKERSLDIDTGLDLRIAQLLLQQATPAPGEATA